MPKTYTPSSLINLNVRLNKICFVLLLCLFFFGKGGECALRHLVGRNLMRPKPFSRFSVPSSLAHRSIVGRPFLKTKLPLQVGNPHQRVILRDDDEFITDELRIFKNENFGSFVDPSAFHQVLQFNLGREAIREKDDTKQSCTPSSLVPFVENVEDASRVFWHRKAMACRSLEQVHELLDDTPDADFPNTCLSLTSNPHLMAAAPQKHPHYPIDWIQGSDDLQHRQLALQVVRLILDQCTRRGMTSTKLTVIRTVANGADDDLFGMLVDALQNQDDDHSHTLKYLLITFGTKTLGRFAKTCSLLKSKLSSAHDTAAKKSVNKLIASVKFMVERGPLRITSEQFDAMLQ